MSRNSSVIAIGVIMIVSYPLAAAPTRHATHATQRPDYQPHQISSSGVLSAADIIEIARLKATSHSDQFSDDSTLRYVGRDFSLVLPETALTVEYDKDSRKLTVSSPKYDDLVELRKEENRSQYVGRNSYGAHAMITRIRGNTYGIWLPGESYSKTPLQYQTNLDGIEARQLSKAIRLRVSGTIIKAEGVYADKSSTIFEKSIISDATIADPYDTWIKQYMVAVKFLKAEWIDARSNAIIRTADVGG